MELTAGAPRAIARRGPGYEYNDKQLRQAERQLIEQAEHAYATMVAHWQPKRPTPRRDRA